MTESLKAGTISGMVWNSVQQFGTKVILLITNLVLARLLSPEDFGCIGMLMVFIAIANTFIDGGFGVVIIQKTAPTQMDYSTIFFWNLILSVLLYVLLFLFAPVIARFYHIPLLKNVLQVQGLLLILNAFYVVPANQLIKGLKFKLLAKLYIVSYSMGAVIGITMAYQEYGVWSLVMNTLAANFLLTCFLWSFNKWRPSCGFSWMSFKEMFSFGSMLLLSNLINTIYLNIQALIIGRVYSARDLGFFSQAKKMEEIPVQTLSSVVQQVTLPVFSKIQNDPERIRYGMQKSIKSLAFVNFPLMILLTIIARPLFVLLFTEKWNESIPYFQILCFSGLFLSLQNINSNILAAVGQSRLIFKWNFVRKGICLSTVIIGLNFWGIYGMLWAIVINSFVEFSINATVASRFSGYNLFEQVRDIFPTLLITCVVGSLVYVVSAHFFQNTYVLLFFSMITFIILYFASTYLFKIEACSMYYNELSKRLRNVV